MCQIYFLFLFLYYFLLHGTNKSSPRQQDNRSKTLSHQGIAKTRLFWVATVEAGWISVMKQSLVLNPLQSLHFSTFCISGLVLKMASVSVGFLFEQHDTPSSKWGIFLEVSPRYRKYDAFMWCLLHWEVILIVISSLLRENMNPITFLLSEEKKTGLKNVFLVFLCAHLITIHMSKTSCIGRPS